MMFGDGVWYRWCQLASAKCQLCVLSSFASLTAALRVTICHSITISSQQPSSCCPLKHSQNCWVKAIFTWYSRSKDKLSLSIICTTWLVKDEMVLALFIVARFSAYKIFRGHFQSIPNRVLCDYLRRHIAMGMLFFYRVPKSRQRWQNHGGRLGFEGWNRWLKNLYSTSPIFLIGSVVEMYNLLYVKITCKIAIWHEANLTSASYEKGCHFGNFQWEHVGNCKNNQFILGVDSNLPFTRWCCWKYTCQWGGRCMGCSRWQLCLHLVSFCLFVCLFDDLNECSR